MFSFFGNWVLYAALGLSVFMMGFTAGHYREKAEFDAYKARVVQAGEIQETRNKEIALQQEKAIDEIKRNYENRMSASTTYYQRLLDNYTRSGKLPTPQTSTSASDAAITYALSHPIDLASDCAKTTVIAQGLQEYIRSTQTIP